MIVPALPILGGTVPADSGVDRLSRQRQLIQSDLRLRHWQRGEDAISRLLNRDISLEAHACRFTVAFVSGKEHHAVPDDGSADRSAELVETDLRL